MARQKRRTVVSEVWHWRATRVIELSEIRAGSASTASATRRSAGRRLGMAPRTRIKMDRVGGFWVPTAVSGGAGAAAPSALPFVVLPGAAPCGGAGTDVGCGAGTADGDVAVPPVNACSAALTIDLAPPMASAEIEPTVFQAPPRDRLCSL